MDELSTEQVGVPYFSSLEQSVPEQCSHSKPKDGADDPFSILLNSEDLIAGLLWVLLLLISKILKLRDGNSGKCSGRRNGFFSIQRG